MGNTPFLNLHVHSHYSTRDSLLSIKSISEKIRETGEAVAVCDHGTLFSWFEVEEMYKQNGLKPVFGVEAYVNTNKDRLMELNRLIESKDDKKKLPGMKSEKDAIGESDHVVLIVKNQHGFVNILRLMNNAYRNGFHKRPLISYNELFTLPKDDQGSIGIIVTSACIGGSFGKMVLRNEVKKAEEFACMMKSHIGNDFYLEIQFNDMDEQRLVNKAALAIGKRHGIRCCIGSDAHFLNAEQAEDHQDLLLLQNKKTRSDFNKMDWRITFRNKNGGTRSKRIKEEQGVWQKRAVDSLTIGDVIEGKTIIAIERVSRVWLSKSMPYRTEGELREFGLKYHPEVLPELYDGIFNANREIYEKIEAAAFDREIKLPQIENADKILSDLVYNALKERFPEKADNQEYLKRIQYELETIQDNGFSEYFLILYDYMKFACEQNIPLGAGRGSGVSSLVGFLLRIHNINPMLRWVNKPLPFERFLSAERNNKKVIIRGKNGEKHEYLDTDIIQVKRNGHIIEVPAIELQVGDIPPQ